MLRPFAPLAAAILLLFLTPAASADSPRRLTWDELPQLVGKHVSIALYDGAAVAGRVREIHADCLLLDVSKTTHPVAYPRGALCVPRATLHVLDLHGKGVKYRVLGATLGFVAGTAGGVGTAIAVQGGLFSDRHNAAAGAAMVGIMSGVTAAGYAIGNAADRRTTTIQIIP